jgi:hypothetical protein
VIIIIIIITTTTTAGITPARAGSHQQYLTCPVCSPHNFFYMNEVEAATGRAIHIHFSTKCCIHLVDKRRSLIRPDNNPPDGSTN